MAEVWYRQKDDDLNGKELYHDHCSANEAPPIVAEGGTSGATPGGARIEQSYLAYNDMCVVE